MATWNPRANDLFLQALELSPPANRRDFLDRACGADAALRQEVEALLAAGEKAGKFLESPAVAVLETIDLPAVAEQPGTVIGPYKLLEQIGEGGFGVVYMAEQQAPLRRKVALKVLKPGMDTRQVVARFDAERQALALMDHPNIARVLDGGETSSGRPYFVMELVRGIPITEVCDQNRLGVRDRLLLFVQVCQAVQHAHQRGVIHRDIKPPNVLVTLHDGRPVPKVIDFGIAKATGQPLTEKTLFTNFAQMIGTPLYMSPEQAQMSGLDVDTRSDIYSLGVLLYELLTGTTPFDRERMRGVGYDEIRRIIREEEPPRPSTRMSTLGQAAVTVSSNRQSDPKRLSQLLRGELDWIVMKALEKDRNRRYETVSAFADDVERYLADEPVQACPPSAGYRLRKFLRRNRGAVVAASIVALALVVGMIGTTLGLFEARRQEKAAFLSAQEEKNAHAAAVESEADTRAFSEFLANHILAATRPEGIQHGVGRNVTMEEALIKAEGKIDEVFRGRPRAEALARHEIGVTWRNLGKYEAAERHLRRALELRQQLFGPEAVETLVCMNSLGVTLNQAGRAVEAIPLHEHALKVYEDTLGRGHPETLNTLNNLAGAYQSSGRYAQSRSMFEDLLARYQAARGPDQRESLFAMLQLASVNREAGNNSRALSLLEEVLEKQKKILPTDHHDILVCLNNLALAYQDAGQFHRALSMFEMLMKKQEARVGRDHPDTLLSMNNLAAAYQTSGKLDKSLPLFEESLEKHKATLGVDHPNTLISMVGLANALQEGAKFGRAIQLLEEALNKQKVKLPPDHPRILLTMNALGITYRAAGKLDQAERLHEEVLEKQKASLGPDHPDTLVSMNNLARVYQEAGKLDRALPIFEQTLAKRTATLGPDHPDTLNSLNNLALVIAGMGKLDQAVPLLEEALEKQKETLGPDHPRTLNAMNNLGGVYRDIGQPQRALPLLEEAMKKQETSLGRDHPDTLRTMNNLALAYGNTGSPEKAMLLLVESMEKHKTTLGPDHIATYISMINLAEAYQGARQLDRALPLFEEVLERQSRTLTRKHPLTMTTMNFLALAYRAVNKLDRTVPLLEETLENRKEVLGPNHNDTLISLSNLGFIYRDIGKLDQALPLLEVAVAGMRKKYGLGHPRTRLFIANLSDCHERMKNPAFSEVLRRELADFERKQSGADSPQYSSQLAPLGMSLLQQKKFADAEAVLRDCLAIREKLGPNVWSTFNTRSSLGGALLGQKKYAEAEPLLVDGYEGMAKREAQIPPEGKQRLIDALERLVKLYEELGKKDEAAQWRARLEARRQAKDKK